MEFDINLSISETGDVCSLIIDEDFNKLLDNLIEEDLIAKIKEKGVVAGIKKNVIQDILNGKYRLANKVILAEKIYPMVGKDGDVKYLINDDIEIKTDEKGNIDYKDTGLIKTVSKGDKLIEIIPPKPGKSGKDVFGNEIPGLLGDGNIYKKYMGKGVKVDEDGKYIIADTEGVYKKNLVGVITVEDKLFIESNLDYSTGNINTTSAIYIGGDVKAGFSVKSSSSIKINGAIEDSNINSGGNLICKLGILSGEKPIIVKEKILTQYIRDREKVECKDLVVDGMISSSNVSCLGEVSAGKIAGGSLSVKDKLAVGELGNESYDTTNISVGINYKVLNRMETILKESSELKKSVEAMRSEYEDLGVILKKIERRFKQLTESNPINPVMLKKVQDELKENQKNRNVLLAKIENTTRRIEQIKKEHQMLSKKVEAENPELIVRDTVYPGVVIRIKLSGKLEIKEEMKEVKFILDDNNVVKAVSLTKKL